MSNLAAARLADNPAKSQVQVITRAATILRALEHENAGLSLGQIASRVGLPRSTVQRIVAALTEEQLLIAATATEGVRLGPMLLRLAASVNTDSANIARPLLAQLSMQLRETVDLSVPRHDHLLFIDQVVGPERLRMVSAVGDAFPLHSTANGKAFLATLDEAEIVRRIGRVYERRTPNTHTTLAALLRELAEIRRVGVAFDEQEHSIGVSAAGVCLQDMLGQPVALSVPMPTQRFADKREAVTGGLLATKRALQEKFGRLD